MSWDQLVSGVELSFDSSLTIPPLFEMALDVPAPPPVSDVARTTFDAVVSAYSGVVTPGMTVAAGAGSRGLTHRVTLLQSTIEALRSLGAEPFVVPAMGSHGGATAGGQIAMLSSLG